MKIIRVAILILFAAAVLPTAFARGSEESGEEPTESEGDQLESEATDATAPEEEPEATTGESGVDPDERTPMDAETAEVIFSLGMSPFENRIPSEDFLLPLLEGGEDNLADYRGKVVFLNFWATWCPPCREEMPSMQVLYDELAEEGLEILAVNVMEDEKTVSNYIDELGFTYPVMLDRQGRVAMRYAVRAYPTTYLLDRSGRVIAVRTGFHEWDSPEMVAGFRTILNQ